MHTTELVFKVGRTRVLHTCISYIVELGRAAYRLAVREDASRAERLRLLKIDTVAD
jgi:hypothetical protein